jgi:hypothetical protein
MSADGGQMGIPMGERSRTTAAPTRADAAFVWLLALPALLPWLAALQHLGALPSEAARQDTLEVMAGGSRGDCGYPFELGASYLVFTEESDLGPRVSICSGTKRIEEAAAELSVLGEPE